MNGPSYSAIHTSSSRNVYYSIVSIVSSPAVFCNPSIRSVANQENSVINFCKGRTVHDTSAIVSPSIWTHRCCDGRSLKHLNNGTIRYVITRIPTQFRYFQHIWCLTNSSAGVVGIVTVLSFVRKTIIQSSIQRIFEISSITSASRSTTQKRLFRKINIAWCRIVVNDSPALAKPYCCKRPTCSTVFLIFSRSYCVLFSPV